MGDCQVCGGDLQPYRHGWLRRCRSCGVLSSTFDVAIPAIPSDAGLDEAAREAGLATLRQENNARLLEALGRLTPGRRLLDVGSGPGFLLSQAAAAGFEVQGVEPDANVVEVARGRGAQVRHGYFPQALEADETFSAIVFNDVIEHVPDIRGAVAASAAQLEPGGVLCLNCPDKRGFFFRTAAVLDRLGVHGPYDRLWQRGLPSPHLWYFTPAMLERLAAGAGLEPAGDVRLATIALRGLWSRIRSVKNASLPLSLASYAFSVAVYPLLSLFPSDARACFFRKPA